MQYYGTRLSENISRREPEGYLLCLNVPVARTGVQEYLPEELGLPKNVILSRGEAGVEGSHSPNVILSEAEGSPAIPERPEKSLSFSVIPSNAEGSLSPRLVKVHRPESEVFSPETIASFEGMPVTNDHPPDGVDIENIRRLQMGHAHNIRRGSGGESDLLLADLIITDPRLIDLILSGKREISCGYTYELHEENGQYVQRRIRGNHIAVVDAGRAGPRVSIKDEKSHPIHFPSCHPDASPRFHSDDSPRCHPDRSGGISIKPPERSNPKMNKPLSRLLARIARDGDTETVAEFIEEMLTENPEMPAEVLPAAEEAAEEVQEAVEPEGTVTVEVPENKEITIDEGTLSGILERLDRLIALLTPPDPVLDEDPAEEVSEIVEEVLEAAEAGTGEENAAEEISGLVESVLEPALSTTVEEGEKDDCGPDPAATRDAMRAVLRAVRPMLAEMTPARRKKACADIAASLRVSRGASDGKVYAALAKAKSPGKDLSALGRKIMETRNSNYRRT